MNSRMMIIDSAVENRAKELLAFASKPENWYKPPFATKNAPGLNEDYVMNIEMGFRVVFSYTKPDDHRLFKHLSISIDDPVLFPNPEAVTIIAAMFEFSGSNEAKSSFKQWNEIVTANDLNVLIQVDRVEHCIKILEEIPNAGYSN